MKKIFTMLFSLVFFPLMYGQTIAAINSGALSNNDFIYSVGEVFVTPVNQDEANSGMIGVISRIEFTSLGIHDVALTHELKFYPNPTSHSVFLELKNEIVKMIYIFDLSGKLIESKTNFNNQFDLSNLQTDTYIIKTDNQKIKSFKIVKH